MYTGIMQDDLKIWYNNFEQLAVLLLVALYYYNCNNTNLKYIVTLNIT